LKSRKIPLHPPFSKGERGEFLSAHPLKALLPLKKGGREGFLGRPFQNTKLLQLMQLFRMAGSKKNLTAEVAENAEVEMAKCPGTGGKGKRGSFFHPSRKINTANGF
jgi:hypothetical protein